MKTSFAAAFVCLVVSVFTSAAQAYIYEYDLRNMGSNYISMLSRLHTDDVDRLSADQKDACLNRYGRILSDGVIDIRIAIGYFDWTVGNQVIIGGANYGYSPSIDLGAFAALRSLLTSRCHGNAEFCGFSQDGNPYRFSKEVVVHDKKYRAQIEMRFASATEYLERNLGRNRDEQEQRSSSSEAFFSSSLQNADAVFYLGHSRNGGGPDFRPPIFISGTNKVNYNGYYKVKRPGLKRMLSALSARQPSVIGLMSCDSRDHFIGTLRNAAPRAGIITSTAVLTVNEVYTGLIGGIDALLRGQCQKTFYQSLRMTPRNQTYITMDGMF